MGLSIDFYNLNEDKHAHLHYSYHGIHILRRYACDIVGAKDENSKEAIAEFPNLVYHSDAEGYYVGFLLSDCDGSSWEEWSPKSQLWVGSVQGLYKELLKVQAHMLKNEFEGDAKKILMDFLKAFADMEYDSEDNIRDFIIVFS